MLTCFSNVYSAMLIAVSLTIYISQIVTVLTSKDRGAPMYAFTAINIILAAALIITLMVINAPYEEILLISLFDTALAMTVIKLEGRK